MSPRKELPHVLGRRKGKGSLSVVLTDNQYCPHFRRPYETSRQMTPGFIVGDTPTITIRDGKEQGSVEICRVHTDREITRKTHQKQSNNEVTQ